MIRGCGGAKNANTHTNTNKVCEKNRILTKRRMSSSLHASTSTCKCTCAFVGSNPCLRRPQGAEEAGVFVCGPRFRRFSAETPTRACRRSQALRKRKTTSLPVCTQQRGKGC